MSITEVAAGRLSRRRGPLADGATIVYRNLLALRRNPALLAAYFVGPLSMIVLFGYVFGSALGGGSAADYRQALIPASFVLVMATGMIIAAGATAVDIGNGVTERLRTLPMRRVALPLGLATGQLLLSAMSLTLMALVGGALGWRWHRGSWLALLGFALLLLFGYAMTWAGVYLGLVIRNVEVVQQLSAPIFGLVMISNAFVPVATMPAVIRAIAEWSPFSAAIGAVRQLFGNGVPATGPGPLGYPVLTTIIWSVAFIVIFATLAARQYGRRD